MTLEHPTLLPAPGGRDLPLTIACSTHPSEEDGPSHAVVIHPDWTVGTQHDLESERVARGLGGWSACLLFAETAVPAYRHLLTVMTDPTTLLRDRIGTWHNSGEGHCTLWSHRHTRLADAVRHELSAEHVTGLFTSADWQLQVDAAARSQFHRLTWMARDRWSAVAGHRQSRLDPVDYIRLWRAGVHPLDAAALASAFPSWATLPLTREYVLSAHFIPFEQRSRTSA